MSKHHVISFDMDGERFTISYYISINAKVYRISREGFMNQLSESKSKLQFSGFTFTSFKDEYYTLGNYLDDSVDEEHYVYFHKYVQAIKKFENLKAFL